MRTSGVSVFFDPCTPQNGVRDEHLLPTSTVEIQNDNFSLLHTMCVVTGSS